MEKVFGIGSGLLSAALLTAFCMCLPLDAYGITHRWAENEFLLIYDQRDRGEGQFLFQSIGNASLEINGNDTEATIVFEGDGNFYRRHDNGDVDRSRILNQGHVKYTQQMSVLESDHDAVKYQFGVGTGLVDIKDRHGNIYGETRTLAGTAPEGSPRLPGIVDHYGRGVELHGWFDFFGLPGNRFGDLHFYKYLGATGTGGGGGDPEVPEPASAALLFAAVLGGANIRKRALHKS